MPYTVNGIGTTYGFSSAKSSYFGTCEFCGKDGMLKSYDTWHSICFLFIPILPFRKLRIVNECKHCERHRYMTIKEWNRLLDSTLKPLLEARLKQPGDPQTLGALVEAMISLGLTSEAINAVQDFANSQGETSTVHYYRGILASTMAKWAEAQQHLEAAIVQDPRNASYHHKLGGIFWESNQRDKALAESARACELDDTKPVYWQVRAWRAFLLEKYPDALAAFEKALELAPQLRPDASIHNAMIACRQMIQNPTAAKPKEFIPPKPPKNTSSRWVAAVLLLLLCGYLGAAYYQGNNRTLYIFNELTRDVVVQLPQENLAVAIPSGSSATLPIAEGQHTVQVLDAKGNKLDETLFRYQTNFLLRIFQSPVLVYNVGGLGCFFWEEMEYVLKGSTKKPHHQKKFIIGQKFIANDDIDFIFGEFPASLRSKYNVKKTRFIKLDSDPIYAAMYLMRQNQVTEALELLKLMMTFNPGDAGALSLYYSHMEQTGQEEQAMEFVRSCAGDNPDKIVLHRFLQDRAPNKFDPKLVAVYQKLLASYPQSPSAHYLYGRVVEDRQKGEEYFQKAVQLDPRFAWGVWALALRDMQENKYDKAEEKLLKILEIHDPVYGTPPELFHQLCDSMYGQGHYEEALPFINTYLHKNIEDRLRSNEYFLICGKLGRRAEAEQMAEMLAKRGYQERDIEDLEFTYSAAAGDGEKMQRLVAKWDANKENTNAAKVQIAFNAGSDMSPELIERNLERGSYTLHLVLCAMYPEHPKAKARLERFTSGKGPQATFAEVARYIGGNSSWEKVMQATREILPEDKRSCLLAAAIAAEKRGNSDDSRKFLLAAKKVNFRPSLPYHAIERLWKKYE